MTANQGDTGEVRETPAGQQPPGLPFISEANERFTESARPQGRIPADTFSNRLMLARALAGHLSIREACERTGLNRGNWQGWERGLRPRDQVETCRIIADALEIDFNWLLFGGPLAGAQGVRVAKRTGTGRVTYAERVKRPMPDRPNVRVNQPLPIYAPNGQGRRAKRVDTERTAEAMYAA